MRSGVLTALLIAAAAAIAGAAEPRFSLGLDRLDLSELDARTEARLAQRSDAMGRVAAHLQQEQANLLGGGQPGGSQGLAFRVKLQSGFAPRLVVATLEAGVEAYERSMGVIRWPWRDSDEEALPIEEQLSLLLGHRLEQPPARRPTDPQDR
ncbi:MAG TPA: hypothetical protein PKJ99_08920 [Thermoanaerobaculales bacterium]|nr:hypothetical protein [Thermoanaerobaculales bacterium]